MNHLKDRIGPYLVDRDPGDEDDVRVRLTPDLAKGFRLVNGRPMYSAAWIDADGVERPFKRLCSRCEYEGLGGCGHGDITTCLAARDA